MYIPPSWGSPVVASRSVCLPHCSHRSAFRVVAVWWHRLYCWCEGDMVSFPEVQMAWLALSFLSFLLSHLSPLVRFGCPGLAASPILVRGCSCRRGGENVGPLPLCVLLLDGSRHLQVTVCLSSLLLKAALLWHGRTIALLRDCCLLAAALLRNACPFLSISAIFPA